jgi:hypothetical protein
MITFIRYMSIVTNVAFMAFLGLLIHDQTGTLRWVRNLNPLWFFFGAVAVVVLAAVLAEWSERRKPQTPQAATPQPGQTAATPQVAQGSGQGGQLSSAA